MSTAPAPFAAEADALKQPQENKQYGRGDADLVVCGEEADQEGAKPHDDNGHRQHCLPADPVAEMSEDRSAQGAGQEADPVSAESRDGTERGIGQWKEQLIENERARRTVNQEIVPLDRRTDDARTNNAPDLGRFIGCVSDK
jgi:hypothetical protein